MKLQLDNELNLGLEGCEISLPAYVTRISTPEERVPEEELVIAAGADPKDGKILLLTTKDRIRVFDARSYYIPDGPAVPCESGKQVFLENVSNRWPGDSEGFYVDSEWLLKNSVDALSDAELSISYPHEDSSR